MVWRCRILNHFHAEPLGQGIDGKNLILYTCPPHTFTVDPFLLAAFCKANPKTAVCDLGAGNGILSFLIYKLYFCSNIYSLEIQKDAFALMTESVTANHLEQVIIPLLGDLRQPPSELPKRSFDLVVCNPPYFRQNPSHNNQRAAAREELLCTLQDVCAAAAALLRPKGRFCVCLRPERLPELFAAMSECCMEPKRLRLAADHPSKSPWLALVEARLQGRPSLQVEPVFFAKNPDGSPSPEMTGLFCPGNV